MKQSLVELVDFILQRIQNNPEAPPSERGMRSWLARQGYDKRDIEAAMKVVRPRFDGLPGSTERPLRSVRTLSVFEEQKLTPAARDALMRLEVYGLLAPYDRELILEQLHHVEGTVGIPELDELLSWALGSTQDVESQQTIFNVVEGREETLH